MFEAGDGEFKVEAADPFGEVVDTGDAAGVAVAFIGMQQHGFPGGHVRAGDGFRRAGTGLRAGLGGGEGRGDPAGVE